MLRIIVTHDCAGCRTAQARARAVRGARPGYPVEVVDLEQAPPPPGVFGTPTYLLDDVVVFLGNPGLSDLLTLLDHTAEHTADHPVNGAVDGVAGGDDDE